jgi:thiamine-phosphate pyrophosphorylase
MPGALSERINGIYVITDGNAAHSHVEIAAAAIAGGASVIQLREKEIPDRKLLEIAKIIRKLTLDSGTLFVINNRVDIAIACGADGVHVGQDDMPASDIRKLIGSEAILGVSTTNVDEAIKAEADGADYIGVGPIFPTMTKTDAGEALGLTTIPTSKQVIRIPLVAIGGISLENVASIASAGANSAAVISAVTGALDMTEAVKALAATFASARKEDKRN